MNYPPKILSLDELLPYRDGLNEILIDKIIEVVREIEAIESVRDFNNKSLDYMLNSGDIEEFTFYFWSLWVKLETRDLDVLNRWLRYWLSIQNLLNPPAKKESTGNAGLTEDDILRAKDVPVQELHSGVLKKMGAILRGECPKHEEKTWSFTIYPSTNSFYCFTCKIGGTSIDYMMKINGLSFIEAVKELIKI